MLTTVTAQLSNSATYTNISRQPASLAAQVLEQQSSIEIRTTLASDRIAALVAQRTLLPSPTFKPISRKRTAKDAELDSEDDEQDEEERDMSVSDSYEDDSGQYPDPEVNLSDENGSAEGAVEEDEFEICEEEDVKHDEEFIQVDLLVHTAMRVSY